MSNVMRISGVLLVAAAVVLALMLKFMSAQMQVWGLSPETVATLLVGGILSLGLGGVISAIAAMGTITPSVINLPPKAAAAPKVESDQPSQLPNMDFGKKRTEAAAPASILPPPVTAKAVATSSVADTIAALEQAKSDIKTALGGVEDMAAPAPKPTPAYVSPPPPSVAEVVEEAVSEGDGELFVVEEKIIRGRPSRILSDDTVEAETDEGWMRFENLEHLNEYLDSLQEDET